MVYFPKDEITELLADIALFYFKFFTDLLALADLGLLCSLA